MAKNGITKKSSSAPSFSSQFCANQWKHLAAFYDLEERGERGSRGGINIPSHSVAAFWIPFFAQSYTTCSIHFIWGFLYCVRHFLYHCYILYIYISCTVDWRKRRRRNQHHIKVYELQRRSRDTHRPNLKVKNLSS